jgi:NAD(P)-dependent dehydrogenase (short-subunit alcohol dehydrogenase family)
MRLKNKVALITGAARGIGLAIAEAFAREGAIVICSDQDEIKCKEESDRLRDAGGLIRAMRCDISRTEEVVAMVQTAIDEYKRIDVLVNNAAIAVKGNIMEMPEEDWDRLMNTNLTGIYRTIKYALPHMIRQQSGSVINISSTQAFRSWHDWTAYAAAKGGIISLTNQLAGQFGESNIRFNSISPGAILTAMNEKRAMEEGPGFLEKSSSMHALNRMGTPEEVAAAAVFLASNESGFITGEDIKVDGGLCSLPRFFE